MIPYKTEIKELSLDFDRMNIQNIGESGQRLYKLTVPIVTSDKSIVDWLNIATETQDEYITIDQSFTSDKSFVQAMFDLRGIDTDLTDLP